MLEKLKVMELKQFIQEQIKTPSKDQFSVLELMDLNFATCTPIAKACTGVVCKINVDVDEFKERTGTNVPTDELAIKMMYNFYESNRGSTEQKRKFDKEYIFPLTHPHWSHVQFFNYFRGRRVDFLLEDSYLNLLEDTTTYYVMELCNTNLYQYIRENNISVPSALLMFYQILDGIKHLYDHEVVHLDLKDNNIYIANRKNIKGTQVVIGDFGSIHPFIYKKHEASNLAYRSPELVNYRKNQPPVDIRKNDVWAAGCILFQLLEGGIHPFVNSQGDTKFNICTGRLPLLTFARHGEGTKQFLKLLWNRDPNKRLDPTSALGICGLLLWGAPNVETSSDYTPKDLQTNFQTFCTTTCKKYSEQDCKQWLRHKINEIHASFSQKQNNDELSFILQVHFFMSFSSAEIFGCMKILSTIYS